jgi:hypothetical protein
MSSPASVRVRPEDKAKVSTKVSDARRRARRPQRDRSRAQVHEFLKAAMVDTSADSSLDLSCIFEDDCPAEMRGVREEVQRARAKDPATFQQLLRFEDYDLSSFISALDISGDVSACGAGSHRGGGRLRLRRERAAHVFKCSTADLVTWQVEQALHANGSAMLGSELQDMLRLHDAKARGWDSVTASVFVGAALDERRDVGVVERGAALPLYGGPLGDLFEGEAEEVAVQCRSCVRDALQQLCFQPQLRGAQLQIRHCRDATFGLQRVRLEWQPTLTQGAAAAAAAVEASAAGAAEAVHVSADSWERRMIDLFLLHGVVGRELSMELWRPSSNPEFRYPDGEYYALQWQPVLRKHEFFAAHKPAPRP